MTRRAAFRRRCVGACCDEGDSDHAHSDRTLSDQNNGFYYSLQIFLLYTWWFFVLLVLFHSNLPHQLLFVLRKLVGLTIFRVRGNGFAAGRLHQLDFCVSTSKGVQVRSGPVVRFLSPKLLLERRLCCSVYLQGPEL